MEIHYKERTERATNLDGVLPHSPHLPGILTEQRAQDPDREKPRTGRETGGKGKGKERKRGRRGRGGGGGRREKLGEISSEDLEAETGTVRPSWERLRIARTFSL